MDNIQEYRELCNHERTIPFFCKDWWLDAVCGKNKWNVILIKKGGEIFAALPYYKVKRNSFNIIEMPKLTQFMGPWIKYPKDQKYSTRLSHEKELMTALIDELPDYDFFYQEFKHSVTNWLPFYWKGFSQTTRYTYVINNLQKPDLIWSNMQKNIRTDIKKAENLVSIESTQKIEEFYKVNKLTFARQQISIPYSLEFIQGITKSCAKHDSFQIYLARDAKEKIHAAIYIVWDEDSTYYLLGGGDPELRNSGATSLLMWHAIKQAKDHSKNFDFEGSMIENVEHFFRSFGAEQTPYHNIYHKKTKLYRIASQLNGIKLIFTK